MSTEVAAEVLLVFSVIPEPGQAWKNLATYFITLGCNEAILGGSGIGVSIHCESLHEVVLQIGVSHIPCGQVLPERNLVVAFGDIKDPGPATWLGTNLLLGYIFRIAKLVETEEVNMRLDHACTFLGYSYDRVTVVGFWSFCD